MVMNWIFLKPGCLYLLLWPTHEQRPWNILGLLSPTEGWNPAPLFDVLLVPVLTAHALGGTKRS